ncbi:hypothetical protein V8E36_008165 [Tilletia maclaganii]
MADRNSASRLSSDWASYMHLQTQLESVEPDPSVIVVKKSPVPSKRNDSASSSSTAPIPNSGASAGHHISSGTSYSEFLASPLAAVDPNFRNASIGDRRSAATAVSGITDDMSEYAEEEVILTTAARVGLKRSPSGSAALVFNRSGESARTEREIGAAASRPRSNRSNSNSGSISGPSIDPTTLANAGVIDSGAPSRTSIGEDSASRHRNSTSNRYSNGTSGWQTPSDAAHSQQSPRSSRSARPLTLPPTEPLPPLPSPNSQTPVLSPDSLAQLSPDVSSNKGLSTSASSSKLAQQASGSAAAAPSTTATSAAAAAGSRMTRALGIEIRPQQSSGNVSRIRANLEASAKSPSDSVPPRSPKASTSSKGAGKTFAQEREFMDRIDQGSAASSASISSAATPAHVQLTANSANSTVDYRTAASSPVTPTAATIPSAAPASGAKASGPSTTSIPASGLAAAAAATPSPASKPQERAQPSAKVLAKTANGTTITSNPPPSFRANPLAGARVAASEQVHGNRSPSTLAAGAEAGAPGGPKRLVRRASEVNLQSRRLEMEEDKSNVKAAPQQRAVILKKAETRFAGAFTEVAQAFKLLQAEKAMLENIIKATTPLDGLSDQGQLSEYLKSMTAKVASNEEEIRKLLELLDQQRAVMDYMLETHERESDAHFDQIDELQVQLDIVSEEAETHRSNCVQLTADLDRAHNDAVAARADVLKLRAALQQETSKCEQAMTLLRAVQHQMKDREQTTKALREEVEKLRARQDDQHHARGRDEDTTDKLSAQHAHELASLSAELRRDLSSKHEADLLSRAEQIRSELGSKHTRDLEDATKRLRTELQTQHKSDIKVLQTKMDSSLKLTKAEGEQRLLSAATAHETELKLLHARLTKLSREGDDKAALDAELRDLRAQQSTMINQLAERTNLMNEMEEKSRALEREVESLREAADAVPPPVPGKDADSLPASVHAQLQAAEARAIAAEKARAELQAKVASLEAGGSQSELATLRAQLVDQRAREASIRNAYKNVQYELRKAQQSSRADDRKRGFLTGVAGGNGSSGSVSGHGGPPMSPIDGAPSGLHRSPSNSSQTAPRQLKRLSLPLVSKGGSTLPHNWMEQFQRDSFGLASGSRPTSASSAQFSHFAGAGGAPPSSYRGPLSGTQRGSVGGPSPSPPNRRQSNATEGGEDDERTASGGTLSGGGHGGGGVLGYGSAGLAGGVHLNGAASRGAPSSEQAGNNSSANGSSSSGAPNGSHGSGGAAVGVGNGGGYGAYSSGGGGRPMSEASAYSINEEDEEVIESDGQHGVGVSGGWTKVSQ